MLVVLDTNVLVSGLAFPGGPPGRLVNAWRPGSPQRPASDSSACGRPRILPALSARTRFTQADVRDCLDVLRATATVVELVTASLAKAQASGLRDPNDVPVLATLIAAGADCLVSGDKDLLALAEHCPILSPAEFCARHAP